MLNIGCKLELEAKAFDLHPLYDQILGNENGLISGGWDIAFMNTDWIAEANEKEAVIDLAPLIAENAPEQFPEGWSESLLGMQRFGERIIGLPLHDGPECLIYRKDLFSDPAEKGAYRARYGKELAPPKTWDEFHQVAQFFDRPVQNLYGTAFALFPDGHNTVFDFCLQLWARGGNLTDKAGNIMIATKEAENALEFYRKITTDDHALHPDCIEMDSVKSGMALAREEKSPELSA